jgi:hypothetical protein
MSILALLFLVLSAFADEIVVAMAGGSIVLGTQPALTGTTIPVGVTYYKANVLTPTWPHPNTGTQDGLADCIVGYGHELVIFERAVQNSDANALITTRVPNLIADAASKGKVPDALVILTGGSDNQTLANMAQVADRQFGPHRANGPGTVDNSVVAQMRSAWGATTPVILGTPSWFNGLDLVAGLPEVDNHYLWLETMGNMLTGCGRDGNCWPVIMTPESCPADTDQHPTQQCYYDMGGMICHQLINALYGL